MATVFLMARRKTALLWSLNAVASGGWVWMYWYPHSEHSRWIRILSAIWGLGVILERLWSEPSSELTAAQRGPPPPRNASCGNVVMTGNVCVSPHPRLSLSELSGGAKDSILI